VQLAARAGVDLVEVAVGEQAEGSRALHDRQHLEGAVLGEEGDRGVPGLVGGDDLAITGV
jgi:hypothetical protein